MEDSLNQLMAIIVPALLSVIGVAVSVGSTYAVKWLKSKSKSEDFHRNVDKLNEAILAARNHIQAKVKAASADGVLTKEELEKIYADTVNEAKSSTPRAIQQIQKAGIKEIDNYVSGKVREIERILEK